MLAAVRLCECRRKTPGERHGWRMEELASECNRWEGVKKKVRRERVSQGEISVA